MRWMDANAGLAVSVCRDQQRRSISQETRPEEWIAGVEHTDMRKGEERAGRYKYVIVRVAPY